MTTPRRAQRFAEALHELERTDDTTTLVAQFAPGAELTRPEIDHSPAIDGPDAFWRSYLSPFASIRTRFTRVAEAEDEAVLEWESRGELAGGRPIEYRGVSLLTYGDGDTVTRFATYFDTAAFTDRTGAT